jgi:hypothetical protein
MTEQTEDPFDLLLDDEVAVERTKTETSAIQGWATLEVSVGIMHIPGCEAFFTQGDMLPQISRSYWSGWRDLNSRPLDPQTSPTRPRTSPDAALIG